VAGEIATAFVSIMPSFQGGGTALTQQLTTSSATAGDTAGKAAGSKFAGSFGTAVKGIGVTLGAAFAVSGAIDFFGGAIKAASDLNETTSKVGVIFGDQAGPIKAWADDAATNLGLPKQAALELVSGFGDMFTQLGFGGDVSATMAKGVATLASDLGSFNNLPTEDVAQRIAAAFRGEYDSLQTLIPNINDARVKQEAMAATGKTVESTLTAQEKAAAVLAIVNKDGAKAQGDFARTSDGLANKQKILSAKFADVKAKIGQALVPVMNTLVGVGSKVIDFFTENAAVIKPILIILGSLGAIIGIVAAAQWIWAAAMAATFWPVVAIVGAIGLLVAGLVLAYQKSETFRDIVQGVWAAVKIAFQVAWTVIKTIFTLWIGFYKLLWEAASTAIGAVIGFFTGLITWVGELPGKLAAIAATIWDWVWEKASAIVTNVATWFADFFAWVTALPGVLAEKAAEIWHWVWTKAGEIKDNVIGALSLFFGWLGDLPGILAEKAGDVFGWFVDAAKNAAAAAWDWLSGAGGGVVGGIDLPGGAAPRQPGGAGAQGSFAGGDVSGAGATYDLRSYTVFPYRAEGSDTQTSQLARAAAFGFVPQESPLVIAGAR
jgi:hypothetical protein